MKPHVNNHVFSNCVLVTGFMLLIMAGGCGYDGPSLAVKELKAALESPDKNLTVIDVRPKSQFDKGHVPGAKNLPLEEIEKKIEAIASMNGEVAIICTCGKRSLAAVKQLADKGITTTLVKGGMKKWKAEGYPKEKSK
ncbi:MAG: rhodanese-like domain-containing protein [Deltaproteobacteria bacterium]|nr:rhodanese-like domain-containing protein [Deltaproteobacteria bacterium]